ncbi:MAG: hypothetical protein ACI88H_001206 [Cocleimonas sp.]|jgi:hypothetical protein
MNKTDHTKQSVLLAKAFNNAWATLYKETEDDNISFDYSSRDMQLNFIEVYKILHVNSGGDTDFMAHWFNTQNTALNGIPSMICKSTDGLFKIKTYLEATLK